VAIRIPEESKAVTVTVCGCESMKEESIPETILFDKSKFITPFS